MSESAFAAYKNTASCKRRDGPKKQKSTKKAGAKDGGASANKNKQALKAKMAAAANKSSIKKASITSTLTAATVKGKAKVASAPVTKAKTPAASKPTSKKVDAKAAAPKSRKSITASSNGGGIKANEVDQLVEELLGDSPSNPRKLTKAQQKKKQELEDYLVRQLEKDDDNDDEDSCSDCDSVSGSDDDDDDDAAAGSDEFSNEYTINTTGSFSGSESDDETATGSVSGSEDESESEDDSDAGGIPNGVEFSLQALGKSKAAPKRKTAASKGAVDAKKSRKQVARCEPEPLHKRRSNGATTTTAAAEENVCKRIVGGGGGGDSNSVNGAGTMTATTAAPMKLEPLTPPTNPVTMNSIDEGLKAFRWLLNPIALDDFFGKYWEKNACLIKRKQVNYFANLISFESIDQMLLKHHVEFTKNIDVTSYKNGVRETLNPEGRALPPVVWDHYGQGCSIRLLNPQTFMPGLFTLSSTLQEYFHCLVGANAYLTPPNSQGFAPHYDDIEAFVLQIEGRKRWKLYKPRTQAEMLPRFSSPNFSQEEIGQPILEEVLQPGDVLYFPRGTIHQACTEPGYHSLHITLSVYQKQSYADLFERMMPLILQRAIATSLDLRRGVPLHMWQHAGVAYADNDTRERAALISKMKQLMSKCLQAVPLDEMMDAAVDQLAKKFQHEALPPEVLAAERMRTVYGSRSTRNERGECVCDYEIELRSNVRLLRANVIRLVQETGDGGVASATTEKTSADGTQHIRIYYYVDNSKEYCEYPPNFIEIESEEAASVEVLIKSYPAYVSVSQLPLADDERKIQVVTALWERGLLMLEKPFN